MDEKSSYYRRWGKRFVDVMVSATALILLAPLLVPLAILVRVRLGGPVLFRQARIGRRMKPFTILKFRTITNACDTGGVLLPDAQRLTPFGKFLRAASIDELLELWNILKGDMSLIGPRPLLPQEVE